MSSVKGKENRRLETGEYEPSFTTRLVGFFLILLVSFPLLSLWSYDWHDIPWLSAGGGEVRNWVGMAGAIGTFFGYSLFGLGIWLLPIWMLVFGFLLITDRMPHPWRKALWALLLQSCISALLEAGGFRETCEAFNIKSAGGAIGWFAMTKCLRPVLGRVGSAQIVIVLAIVAIVFGIGWRNWQAFVKALIAKFREWRLSRMDESRRAEQEELRRLREEAKAEKEAEKERQRAEREAEKEAKRQEREERQRIKDEARAAREAAYEAEKERLRLEREEAERRRRQIIEEAQREDAARNANDGLETAGEDESNHSDSTEDTSVDESNGIDDDDGDNEDNGDEGDNGFLDRHAPRSNDAAPLPIGGDPSSEKPYTLPSLDLLSPIPEGEADAGDTEETAAQIAATLAEFRVPGDITHVEMGPVITTYEFLPAQRIRPEQVAAMDKTLEMRIKAKSLRIEAPIPGKGVCGIEVPNKVARSVTVREVLEGETWRNAARKLKLPLLLGKDASGHDLVVDMADMPHLLVAGATGSGKSVCMNAILTGLLMSRTPEELKLILVDPKVVEFAGYKEIPHLVVPVITDPKKVALGLIWAIHEMERRYKLLSEAGVKNIASFNDRKPAPVQQDMFETADAEPQKLEKLPYILIVIDEMADLMLQVKKEIEDGITRLAQKSRAVGIHLILATQRPTVNIVTGTIKANIAGRIAFQVAQKNDSKTIIDRMGAESLIGRGDMLFLNPRTGKTIRAQGAFITDGDAEAVTDYIRSQAKPKYSEEAQKQLEAVSDDDKGKGKDQHGGAHHDHGFDSASSGHGEGDADANDGNDPLYQDAIAVIRRTRRASTSSLQRALGIGYGRAARIFDQLEARGIVGPSRGALPREILIDLDGEIPTGPTNEE